MKIVRIILKENEKRCNVYTMAWNENWRVYKQDNQNDGGPYQEVWQANEERDLIRYIEDPLLKINYFVIDGDERFSLAEKIKKSKLDTYTYEEIIDCYKNSEDIASLIYSLGLLCIEAIPDKFDIEIFNIICNAIKHESSEVRKAAIIAIAYIRWRQFEKVLAEVRDNDKVIEIAAFSRDCIDSLKRHNWEEYKPIAEEEEQEESYD